MIFPPLHEVSDELADSAIHLYAPKPTYRMRQGGRGERDPLLEGQNHPNGAMLYFHLAEIPEEEGVFLEILEEDGTLVKRFSSVAEGGEEGAALEVKEGANLFVWDLRYADALSFDGLILYSSNTRGPVAVPGTYRARLTAGDQISEQTFEILKDPRVQSTQADLQAQFDFLIAVRDKLSEAHQAVINARRLFADLDYIKAKASGVNGADELLAAIEALRSDASVIENNLHETRNEAYQDPLNFGIKLNNRLAYLATHESSGDYAPTDQGQAYFQEVSAQIDVEVAAMEALLSKRLPALDQMARDAGIGLLATP